jgi:hypothetical protein
MTNTPKQTFFDVWRAELLRAVEANPSEYAIREGESPALYAAKTADRMIAAMRASQGVGSVNTNSRSFRRACKVLGIPYTRTAMSARIQEDIASEEGDR